MDPVKMIVGIWLTVAGAVLMAIWGCRPKR